MRRSRYFPSLLAAAALAVPLLAAADPRDDHAFLIDNGEWMALNIPIDPAPDWTAGRAAAIGERQRIAAMARRAGVCQALRLDLVSAVPEPPVAALLAAGLALGLARGKGGFRRPVRRRRG